MSRMVAKSTITMVVNMQRLRHMILDNGQHHPSPAPAWLSANQADASTTAATSYATVVPSQQGYPSSYMVTPPPVGGQDQYTEFLALAAVDLAKRGVTLHGSLPSHERVAGYKRKRDEQPAPVLCATHAQQQQTIVVDPLPLDHVSKDLAEQRKKHMRLITSVTEDKAEKRLKAKDLEMDLIKGENKVLQEKVRNLHREAQVWRDVARSNEVAVNVLRGKLQHALAQAAHGRGIDGASSSYLGNKHVTFSSKVWNPEAAASVRRCKGCGQGKAMVLLLPCSHLSVCKLCADGTRECPACGCAKTGSIYVNLS